MPIEMVATMKYVTKMKKRDKPQYESIHFWFGVFTIYKNDITGSSYANKTSNWKNPTAVPNAAPTRINLISSSWGKINV